MAEHHSRGGAGEHAESDDPVSVLYVDADEGAVERVVSYLEAAEGLTATGASDETTAREYAAATDYDCLVVDTNVGPAWSELADARGWAVVVYTAAGPRETDDRVFERADSFLNKGDIERSRTFLARKVRGVVCSRRGDVTPTPQENVERVADDVAASLGLFVVDDDGRLVWSNVAIDEWFPGHPGPAAGGFYDRLAAMLRDDPGELLAVLEPGESNTSTDGQVVSFPADGEPRHFCHYSYPVDWTAPGSRVEVFQRIDHLVERYDRAELFGRLAESTDDGLYALDADGRLVYCNDSYAEMLGYDPGELVGRHVSEWMAEGELEAGQAVVEELAAAEEGSAVVDHTLVTADGDRIESSVNISPQFEGGVYRGLVGVVRDITERKARERELRQYRRLVESAGDPMYVLDTDGTIRIANEAMATFVGRPAGELVGTDIREVTPESAVEEGNEAVRTVLRSDRSAVSFETWLADADGDRRLFEVTVGVITEAGEFAGTAATFRDVTERHRRREELDKLKEIFARALRHDIRNKAAVIEGYATLLADALPADQAEMVEAILDASAEMARTSEKVGRFNETINRDGGLTDHELPAVVSRSVETVDTGGVTVETDVPALTVRALPAFRFAVQNLVENAVLHGADPDGRVSVTARRDGDHARVVVSDDGPGIPAAELRALQEGEETALEHASGIGLWFVDDVVRKSGGDLTFETDGGTRVVARVPLAD